MTMVRNYVRATPATALIAAVCIIAWLITAVQARTLGATFYDSRSQRIGACGDRIIPSALRLRCLRSSCT